MVKVLIVTHDLLGERMAGPAIRCFELGKQLSRGCNVTLASPLPIEGKLEGGFPIVSFADEDQLLDLARATDVLLLQGLMLRRYPKLKRLGKYLVMDLYDPFIFECYPHFLAQPGQGAVDFMHFWDVMNEQMEEADFSICASERQRDMWIGRYCGLGRLIPPLFEQDPSFRRLIDLVPFGISDAPPRHERAVIKGVVPGIEANDKVLLWGGGIWNWFDPLTVIRAVGRLAETRQDVKLYFLGVKHPNPEIPDMEMMVKAVHLAEELGLKDRHVFFNFGWVPYEERQNYLLEADIGISSHFDSIETRFSFRTRVLDYLWAGLPILTTQGDSMAELVGSQGLGVVARYENVDDWVSGISRLLDDQEFVASARIKIRDVADGFHWSKVAQPLARFCEAPYSSPRSYWSVTKHVGLGETMPTPVRLALKTYRTLKTGGLSVLLKKGTHYIGMRLKKRGATP